MVKHWTYVGLLGLCLALSGCGGSTKGTAETGGLDLASYEANLPDGTPMVIDFVTEANGRYTGSFAVDTEQGTYADQTGTFFATVSGGQLTADCVTEDGKTFQMVGAVNGSQGLRLTRSDIAGSTLVFSRIPAAPAGRADYTFFLDGLAGTKGTVSLNSTPNSVVTSGSTTIREYKGTWQGVPVVFWSYSSGYGNLLVYVDPLCVMSSGFTSYQPSDFPTKSVTATTGYMTMYNATVRAQLKFKTLPSVSPN